MKATLEIVRLTNDIVTASGEPCPSSYTQEIGGGCTSGIPDDE